MHEGPTENRLSELGSLYKYYYYCYYYKLTSYKFLKVSEASVNAWGHSRAATEQATVSLEVDLFRLNGIESYYKFIQIQIQIHIDICCVGSGMKYHSLSNWSIVMTSLVESSTGEFRSKPA